MQKITKTLLSQNDIEKITLSLKNDGIVAYPTDTVWGLGADPTNETAVKKIYELKKRDGNKPLILMASKFEYLEPFIEPLSDIELDVIKKYNA